MNIVLTELAASKVKEIKEAQKIGSDNSLRVKIIGSGCNGFSFDLFFDKLIESDVRIENNGVDIIADYMSAMYLDGTIIDYVEGLTGAGFKFSNDNIKSSCGCGKSVSF